MRILTYGNRKVDPIYWDASTPELESAAYLALFQHLKDEWEVYTCPEPTGRQKTLYNAAINGDAKAAKQLLTARKSYEYEYWALAEVVNPLKEGYKG